MPFFLNKHCTYFYQNKGFFVWLCKARGCVIYVHKSSCRIFFSKKKEIVSISWVHTRYTYPGVYREERG